MGKEGTNGCTKGSKDEISQRKKNTKEMKERATHGPLLGGVEGVFGYDSGDVSEGYFRSQRVTVANDRHICPVPDINCQRQSAKW